MVNRTASVILFIGTENYLKEEAVRKLKEALLGGGPAQELDYKIFYGSESSAMEILDYAVTFPFSAAKKLVVIKDVERLSQEDKARLVAYIKKPAPFTCLVLDASDLSKLDDLRSVHRYIKMVRYGDLTDSEVTSWIKRFAESRGKSIERDAVEILKELQGMSLSSLAQEVEKLAAFTGEETVIKASDVEELAGKSYRGSAFDIGSAIGNKRTDKALSLLSDLVLRGRRPYEMIGPLYWNLKKFGKRDNIDTLLRADLDIKNTRYDPRSILEFAIVKLCLG